VIVTQAIRSKILDLAMRGKLTEQLLEDGTAEELYRQIQAEKQKLIKSGKIKKEKPLPEISNDEVPFPIPNSWKWERLGALLRVISGISYEKSDVSTSGLRILRGGNIQNTGIILDHSDVFLPPAYKDDDKIVRKGDVIVVASTGSETAIGRAGYAEKDYESTMIGAFLRICRPIEPSISMYIRAIFMSDYYLHHIRHESKGTNINNVKEKYITHFVVPMPPLAEQHRIVARIEQAFSALDTIDALQAKYADNLAVLKSKLIDAAIRGKLTDQLPEDGTAEELYRQIQAEKARIIKERNGRVDKAIKVVGEDVPYLIPAHWKWIRFGDVGLFKKGPFGSALTKSMFVPKSAKAIKVYEQQHAIKKNPTIGTYYISESYFRDKMKGFEVKSGDILISCAGTIGETYVMPNDIEPGIINQALMRVTLASGINKRFFQYYFDSRLKSSAKEGNGSAIVNIPPFDVIKNWYFPLPPLAEQKRIVERVSELLAVCDELK